ncbi:MAG: flagellin [Selenomonas sp.]
MPLVVKNNMQAANTLNTLNKNEKDRAKSLAQVSSGMKITSAGDDPSGMSISERMRVQIRALDQDNQNTQNGNSMMKVAEGAVASTVEILRTLKEKCINAANDTNTDDDRATIQKEMDAMVDQINDNANIQYNGKILMSGTYNNQVVKDANNQGTKSSWANQSFAEGTNATGTALTAYKDRNGNGLGILPTDYMTVSYVKDGKTYEKTFRVGNYALADCFDNNAASTGLFVPNPGGADLEAYQGSAPNAYTKVGIDQYGHDVVTADGKDALTIRAKNGGTTGQIGGVTFCLTDSQGNIKKAQNNMFDKFQMTVRAQDPTPDNAMVFQIGTRSNQAVKVGFTDMHAKALGMMGSDSRAIQVTTRARANAAVNVIENAIGMCLDQQTVLGAAQARLQFTSSNIITASENTQGAESTIRDADMAKAMTDYTKSNILTQTAQAMLAQANQSSSGVLSLLQ